MARTKIEIDDEIKLTIYGIVNTDFLKIIHPLIKSNLLKTPYARMVWKWISEHYTQFGEAPGKYISDIYKSKRAVFQEDDSETNDAIALFLTNLSNKYSEYEEVQNIDPYIVEAKQYLEIRSLEVFKEELSDALANHDIEKARQLQEDYRQPARDDVIEYTGTKLLETEFKEPVALVPELLMLGSCALLIGSSKIGKSWFALQLAIAISSGGPFLKWKCSKRKHVLYLANEDSERILKERVAKLKPGNIDNLHLLFNWQTRGIEAVHRVKNYIKDNPKTRLVIIDCLGTVKGKSNNKNAYLDDYMEIQRWRDLCHELGITILIIHHPKKTIGFNVNDYDLMELINGSNGYGGAADRIMFLLRKREEDLAKLFSYGRDSKDLAIALEWTPPESEYGWIIKGNGNIKEVEESLEHRNIINLLEDNGEMTLASIAHSIGKSSSAMNQILKNMVRDGKIIKTRHGRYAYES